MQGNTWQQEKKKKMDQWIDVDDIKDTMLSHRVQIQGLSTV